MTLAAASTALNISITLIIIVLVVVSLLMILVVMMQRPKQEGLGAAFGGGMTDQLLGAGTTSFLQKSTVVLGILFFVLSLILGILVGKSNKQAGLTALKPVPTEQTAAPVPDIASGVDLQGDGAGEDLLQQIESAVKEAQAEETAEPSAETTSESEDLDRADVEGDEPLGEDESAEEIKAKAEELETETEDEAPAAEEVENTPEN